MTGRPAASVVIPTFNRLADLQRVLAAVGRQRAPAEVAVETVVVDDGSDDGTFQWLRDRWLGDPGRQAMRQANAGPAAARNRGVQAARGELILFLGDDTEPEPGWLLEHLETHRLHGAEGPLAVLGYTAFPRRLAASPFLRHINETGAQFGYGLIDDAENVPFNFFYTSNISVPRRVLLELGGFREDFPAAAWEDIELAYRGATAGLRIRYRPRARAVHHHRVRPRTFCRRQRTSGHSGAIFAALHPELEDFLGVGLVRAGAGARKTRHALLGGLVTLGELIPGLVPAGVFQRWVEGCYHRGLAEGLQARFDDAEGR